MEWMVFDVESLGLHGGGYAIGYVILVDGVEIANGCWASEPKPLKGEYDSDDYTWARENVPHQELEKFYCKSAKAIWENFWMAWRFFKQTYPNGMLAADVAWPVEANFLSDCIADCPEAREGHGPYPLADISSIMLAVGMDPLAPYVRREDELPAHHPIMDARQSARLLLQALSHLNGKRNID